MKLVALSILALLVCCVSCELELLSEQELENLMQNENLSAESRGFLINSLVKDGIDDVLNQLHCGWPEYGIPPLAPYTNADLELSLNRFVLDSFLQMSNFRFDGLDEMKTINVDVSYFPKKIAKFHFNYKQLNATASSFYTNTFLDLMQQLNFSVRYEGKGSPLAISFENLDIKGKFKYKLPFVMSSVEIHKLQVTVTLGSVHCDIGGVMGNGKLNALVNQQMEIAILAGINGKQAEISDMIAKTIEPLVNEKMKGKKIWSLLGGSKNKCDPTPAPWLAVN